MLNTPAARLVREHRREVERIERLRRFAAAAPPPLPPRPPRPARPFVADLSGVPPKIIAKLQALIHAIENREKLPATSFPSASSRSRPG